MSAMETLVTETMQANSAWIYIFGHMPSRVQSILSYSRAPQGKTNR